MNLACRFNQILKVCTREEVTEIDEFAVIFVFNVYHSPAVLASPDLLAIHDDGFFASHDGKWDDILNSVSHRSRFFLLTADCNLDLCIHSALLIVEFVVVIRVHLEVMESKLLLDSRLELLAFFEGQRVGLRDDGHNVDNVRELLKDNNIDRFQPKIVSSATRDG